MKRLIDVSILAAPEAEAGVVLGIYDALWSVGRLWNQVNGLEEAPCFRPRVVAASAAPLRTATGISITPSGTVSDEVQTDVVFVPSLLLHSGKRFTEANPALLNWVKRARESGAQIVSSCTGSFLLAEAGLLDGCDATTHWAFIDAFRAEYPHINVHGDRIIVAADKSAQVVTAGGASSWTDLTLYLVGRYAGEEEARRLAQMSLFDWHYQGQNPYARLVTRPQGNDRIVQQAQEWLALHYHEEETLNAMIGRSGLSARSFTRRFRAATGRSPLEYVQLLRVEEAKQMLERDGAGVEEIAYAVGYRDLSSFRRLFKRLTGCTPVEYRRRFQTPAAVRALG